MECKLPNEATRIHQPTVSVIPEVVGQARPLVDPPDIQAMAGAIVTLLTDEERRKELIERDFDEASRPA